MGRHQDGLAKVIQQLIGPLVRDVIDQEYFGIVSIPHVKVTKDFDYADVYVSVFENKEELKHVLRENVYHIQKDLNKKIQRGRVPKIRFFTDDTGEFAEWVENTVKS